MSQVLRILVVEDELALRLVARVALEKVGGFQVQCCASGADALAVAPTFCPDLLLLDVMMPGMDGPNTLQALRTLPNLENTPAIFLTAKVQTCEISALLKQGAIGVLGKPFDPMALSRDIWTLWHQRGVELPT